MRKKQRCKKTPSQDISSTIIAKCCNVVVRNLKKGDELCLS